MNDIQIFSNEQFGQVRVITKDSEPWLCLSDICKSLGLGNVTEVKKRLNSKGLSTIETLTNGGKQNLIYVDESNFYKVIFQSRKAEAEKFTEWVTSDVLPSIRKHGMYATDELINNPDLLIAAATKIKEERQARLEAEKLRDKLIRGFIGSGQNRNMICINESGLYSLILGRLLMTTVKNQLWNGVTIRYVVNMMLNPYLPELPKRYFRK